MNIYSRKNFWYDSYVLTEMQHLCVDQNGSSHKTRANYKYDAMRGHFGSVLEQDSKTNGRKEKNYGHILEAVFSSPRAWF